MFRMFRFYSIASLVSIIGTAVVMAFLYRNVAVHSIIAVAENNNLAMAEIALDPIRQQLADFLSSAASVAGDRAWSLRLPAEIDNAIVELMRNPRVKRVKVYNRDGIVVFSTKTSQIGGNQENNEGFVTAMGGRPAVELIYRDTFNVFDDETEEDNLVQSYIPVRRRPTEPVAGVFEVYTDVNSLVAEAERTQFKIIAFTIVVLAALYGVLLIIVHRARDVIDAQEQTIREKSAILEELSKRSLRREERERKKVAGDLHEGLAQTLTAIKLAVESARDTRGAGDGGADALNSVVPALQGAIGQVRTIATDLSPPSLDDLGLAATLNASIREFAALHPTLRIEQNISADEVLIPAPLKTIVYRNVEAALRIIGERHTDGDIRISLVMRNRTLILFVGAHGKAAIAEGLSNLVTDTQAPLSTVRERTIISGGDLAITRDDAEGIAFRASWRL